MNQSPLSMEAPIRMKLKTAATLAVGVLMTMSLSPSTAAALEVGQPFPDLVLPALEDGRPTSLADFRGRKLVLHVFASW